MDISFDPVKDEWTRRERGFSLALGEQIIRGRVHLSLDDRRDYGENRYLTYGYIGERLYACVFTIRNEVYHIISVRKANDREGRKYGR